MEEKYKLIYKKTSVIMPHCPICKNVLGGNGSVMNPYYCECGEWQPQDIYDFNGEYKLKTKLI